MINLEGLGESPEVSIEKPKYPYGTTINLSGKVVKALGGFTHEVGSTIQLAAKVKVIEVSQEIEDDKAETEVKLQIVGLELENNRSAAQVLYSDD